MLTKDRYESLRGDREVLKKMNKGNLSTNMRIQHEMMIRDVRAKIKQAHRDMYYGK